jgi:hypothetical protein
MLETASVAADLSAPDDLISFLKAIPHGSYRRGVRYPQWFLLLVAVLGILSGSDVTPFFGPVLMRVDGRGHAAAPG